MKKYGIEFYCDYLTRWVLVGWYRNKEIRNETIRLFRQVATKTLYRKIKKCT